MDKEVRSTIYLEEDLYKRFREACNKKFGDKQGKIKQGYVLAITNFCNQVLEEVVDIVIEMKEQPEVSAKKLEEAKIKTPQEVIEESKNNETSLVVAKETPQDVVETPQEVVEIPTSTVDTPPVSATIPEQAETVSVDEGLAGLVNSLQTDDAVASVKLDQDKELQTIVAKAEPSNKEVDKPEEVLEEERLAKVREDQRLGKLQTQSQFVGENSVEAKAKRLADRRRKAELEQAKDDIQMPN